LERDSYENEEEARAQQRDIEPLINEWMSRTQKDLLELIGEFLGRSLRGLCEI
jgi:hypothetical protein